MSKYVVKPSFPWNHEAWVKIHPRELSTLRGFLARVCEGTKKIRYTPLKTDLYILLKSQCLNKILYDVPANAIPATRLESLTTISQLLASRPCRIKPIIELFKKIGLIEPQEVTRNQYKIRYHRFHGLWSSKETK